MAQINFKGNATKDTELKFTPNGNAVINVDVAENHWKKNGQEFIEDGTTFYRVAIWGSLAERLAGSIHRGTTLTVAGEFRGGEFEGKNGSIKTYEVNAKTVGIVPKAEQNQQGQQSGGWADNPQQAQPQQNNPGWGSNDQPAPF